MRIQRTCQASFLAVTLYCGEQAIARCLAVCVKSCPEGGLISVSRTTRVPGITSRGPALGPDLDKRKGRQSTNHNRTGESVATRSQQSMPFPETTAWGKCLECESQSVQHGRGEATWWAVTDLSGEGEQEMVGAAEHMRLHRALGPKLPNRVGALQKTVECSRFSVKASELPKRDLWVVGAWAKGKPGKACAQCGAMVKKAGSRGGWRLCQTNQANRVRVPDVS